MKLVQSLGVIGMLITVLSSILVTQPMDLGCITRIIIFSVAATMTIEGRDKK